MLSTFPYNGGRFNQLRQIVDILDIHRNEFDVVVDVFGGSGKALLNILDEWKKVKVYNDIDLQLYTTFKVLQNTRKRELLEKRLKHSINHEAIFRELKRVNYNKDVDIAFKTIYLHTFSYAGAGTSFKRFYKKANIPPLKTDNFFRVKKWVVESQDFRSLMGIYSKPRVLLYLDPPYLRGGKTYRHSFKIEDFEDLNKLLRFHKGTYLMNLSMFDPEMCDIFGNPQMIAEHHRPTVKGTSVEGNKWGCGYWWRF